MINIFKAQNDQGRGHKVHIPDLPEPMLDLLEKMLRHDPEMRPSAAACLRHAALHADIDVASPSLLITNPSSLFPSAPPSPLKVVPAHNGSGSAVL